MNKPPLGSEDDDDGDELNNPQRIAHRIAIRAAHSIVLEAHSNGLPWTSLLTACETVVAILVSTVGIQQGGPDASPESRRRFAQEIIDAMTERSFQRVVGLMQEYEDKQAASH